jgi:hypothetical protein
MKIDASGPAQWELSEAADEIVSAEWRGPSGKAGVVRPPVCFGRERLTKRLVKRFGAARAHGFAQDGA